ncbi:MAG: ATP-binding protein [Chitinophagaceae bacterium]|jgi:hypothetical protein
MITLSAPKYFTINYIKDFLKTFEHTFDWKGKLVIDVEIDLSKVVQIDILGMLVLYKYIDYTYANYCFKKPNLYIAPYVNDAWAKYQFEELIQAYVSNKAVTERAFKEFKVKIDDKFIIAPQALLRETNYTNEYLKNEFIPKVETYYHYNQKCVDIIFNTFSEILLNFWEHAVDDTKSVILADGNKDRIEIACADTGIGIVENLNNLFGGKIPKLKLLEKALQKGITSKPNTFHMGFGLWLVSELVKANKGRLHIYSQGYYYHNDYGKVKQGTCPNWPGSVIYINIPLKDPKNLSDVLGERFSNSDIKINFA